MACRTFKPNPEPRQWARDKHQELAILVPSPALWHKKYGGDRNLLESTPLEQRMLPREVQYIDPTVQHDESDPLIVAIGKENAALMTLINSVKASTLPDQFISSNWMQQQKVDILAKYKTAEISEPEKMADVFMEQACKIIGEALQSDKQHPKAKSIKRPGTREIP